MIWFIGSQEIEAILVWFFSCLVTPLNLFSRFSSSRVDVILDLGVGEWIDMDVIVLNSPILDTQRL